MLSHLFCLVFAPLALAQCQTSFTQVPGTVGNHTLCIGSSQRTFLLFVPQNYNANSPRPLIVSYHGGSRTALSQLRLDQFTNPFFNTEAIVVYPQGIDEKWQGVPGVKVNDIQFTNMLLDYLIRNFNIDQRRIWASGKSDGGGFVGLLACDPGTSQRIAAFAPVAGAFYTTTSDEDCDPKTVSITCNPGRLPLPFIEFHGGSDDTISYDGGARREVCLPSIPHYLKAWAMRDRLGDQKQTLRLTSEAVIHSYGNGLVRGYYEEDIGHDWPSTVENSDNDRSGHHPASYNATQIIVDFFHQHSLRISRFRV